MTPVLAAVSAAAIALSAPAASALGLTADYSAVVVFGDSLSDPGNLDGTPFAPPPPYFEAMFSDGPVWALELTAGFAPGTAANFAVGGATALGDALGNTLAAQRARFDAALGLGALTLGPRPLAVHWIGANDVFGLTDPVAAAARVTDEIADLAGDHDIRDFLVLDLPDQGATPGIAARGPAAQAAISAASAAYNAALATGLDGLDPALHVTRVDIAGLFEDLLASPADFDVSNVTEPCFDGAAVCADPGDYAFWDGVHPTAAIHGEIADAAFAALAAPVPLPATLPLLAVGAVALARLRRAA
jgi:outer membrane lipase/esterase